MEKYMVGNSIIGYNTIEASNDYSNVSDSIIVVVLDERQIDVPKYYKFIKRSIENGNKIVVVSTEKSEQFSIMAALMVSLGHYDVYTVSDRDVITAGYLEAIEKRKPTYMEVQQFIGGEIAAYSSVTELLMTMQNMIDDCDLNGLKSYIEDNRETIEHVVRAIDIMRKYAELTNSAELVDNINELKGKVQELDVQIVDLKTGEKNAVEEKIAAEEEAKQLKAEKTALMNRVENLEEQVHSGTPVISYYNEVNLAYTKHKIQRVLYFKEISYVPHTMSMINSMYELLTNSCKMRVKFVIYDNSTEIYEPYIESNIKIINSKNYTVNKPMLVGKNSCLIAEPNPAITNDLLTVPDGYDILIIYDRMHRYENIIVGNNVTRIIVSSSSKELQAIKKKINITVSDMVLTTRNSSIHLDKDIASFGNIIDIEEIENYSKNTDSAKVSKYAKMQCSSGDRLFQKIFSVSNIEAMLR